MNWVSSSQVYANGVAVPVKYIYCPCVQRFAKLVAKNIYIYIYCHIFFLNEKENFPKIFAKSVLHKLYKIFAFLTSPVSQRELTKDHAIGKCGGFHHRSCMVLRGVTFCDKIITEIVTKCKINDRKKHICRTFLLQ